MSAVSTEKSKPSKTIKIKPQPRKKKSDLDIYSLAIISKNIFIPINNVGRNIKDVLQRIIANEIDGKCITQGYIKPDSVKIITYSSGVVDGSDIHFQVVFECNVCSPVEGMHINCIAKNITKAGIRAELGGLNSPVVIFIARDHNYMSKSFSEIQIDQQIKIRVIGQRYELNDKYISVIGELVDDSLFVSKLKNSGPVSLSKLKVDSSTSPKLNIEPESIKPESIEPESIEPESIKET